MLQLKHIKYLGDMTGAKYSEITPFMFGTDGAFDGNTFVAATALVPLNSSLIVLRVQCYLVNTDTTASDYLFYRAFPPCDAYWEISNDALPAAQFWAPGYLDTDVLLIFPPNKYANLIFTPTAVPPVTGTWIVRTIVFGYLVPARVTDALAQTQALTSG